MSALSPARIEANEIWARRGGPPCAPWPSAAAQSRNLGEKRATTTRLSQSAPTPARESRPPGGPPFQSAAGVGRGPAPAAAGSSPVAYPSKPRIDAASDGASDGPGSLRRRAHERGSRQDQLRGRKSRECWVGRVRAARRGAGPSGAALLLGRRSSSAGRAKLTLAAD